MGREGDQEVGVGDEDLDARKAAGWSVLAGLARLAVALVPDLAARPWPIDALLALASGLVLPAIAVLHVRHALVRRSGAVLTTIAGTVAVVACALAVRDLRLRPAALFVLGMWWWTIGKMWAETDVLPRAFGVVTAALGALAIVGSLVPAFGAPDQLAPPTVVFGLSQLALGVWLVALAAALWRRADVPSP